jgi:hypothetical protein
VGADVVVAGRAADRGRLTVAGFVKAVPRVAVRSKDGDLVSTALQRNGSVDDEPLGAANAEVRMQEDKVLLLLGHGGSYRVVVFVAL